MSHMVVQCKSVSYRYESGAAALHQINLEIASGEYVLLAGANGSGKSTLCRIFNGLIPHLHGGELEGMVQIDGHDTRSTPSYMLSRRVGLVLQNPDAQCFGSTVARDLAFGLACQGTDRGTIIRRVHVIAEQLNIQHLLERAPHTLSGGEQQRVALAGVLALEPALLVLDEPIAFLDPRGVAQLRALLQRLHQQGVTIVVAEHRLAELVPDASRMVVLHEGRIVADGVPDDVLAQNVEQWGLDNHNVPNLNCEATEQARDVQLPAPSSQPSTSRLQPSIEWDHVSFERDGRPVLHDVALAAAQGEVIALLGANGAGKTTLLQHANGLLRPQRGEVRVLGQAVSHRPVAEMARDVGYVAQQPTRMLFAATVRDEIAAGPRALDRYDPHWCAELARRWDLEPLLDRVPQQLSAGQQRRLAIAAVLALRPRVLLLDEPTAGLDAAGRHLLDSMIEAIAAEGVTVMFTTHDLAWAYRNATRWAVLASGRLVAVDTPPAVCANPTLLQQADLLQSTDQRQFTGKEEVHAVER